jgi:hypothetical protein
MFPVRYERNIYIICVPRGSLPKQVKVKAKVTLRPTASRLVFDGVSHRPGVHDQFSATVRQWWVFDVLFRL